VAGFQVIIAGRFWVITEAGIARKLKQAEFHLGKIRAEADEFAIECYFAAFLACVRSVVFYVETWMTENGKVANKTAWLQRLHAWESAQPVNDVEYWKVLTRLRNLDIHEEPIIPDPPRTIPSTGGFMGSFMGSFLGSFTGTFLPGSGRTIPRQIKDGQTGRLYAVTDVCERSLAVAKKLLDEHQTL
jgi:hypothetical protein